MKQLFLFVFLLMAATSAFSQKCKFDTNKADPLTGEMEQRINFRASYNLVVGYVHKGNDYRFEAKIQMPGKQDFKVVAGSKLDMKLAGGKIVSLENSIDAPPAGQNVGEVQVTLYAMSYKITKEQYEEMAASGIAFIRVTLHDTQTYDYTFKPKDTEKSKADVTCILGK